MKHTTIPLLCAWLLWSQTFGLAGSHADTWLPMQAYPDQVACETERQSRVLDWENLTKAKQLRGKVLDGMLILTNHAWDHLGTSQYKCWPSTIDPRVR